MRVRGHRKGEERAKQQDGGNPALAADIALTGAFRDKPAGMGGRANHPAIIPRLDCSRRRFFLGVAAGHALRRRIFEMEFLPRMKLGANGMRGQRALVKAGQDQL